MEDQKLELSAAPFVLEIYHLLHRGNGAENLSLSHYFPFFHLPKIKQLKHIVKALQ